MLWASRCGPAHSPPPGCPSCLPQESGASFSEQWKRRAHWRTVLMQPLWICLRVLQCQSWDEECSYSSSTQHAHCLLYGCMLPPGCW